MSAESSGHLVGWDCVRNALDEIRASSSEFDEFFSEVFDELGSLMTELAGQRQKWHQEQQQTQSDLGCRAAQVEEDHAALQAQRERTAKIDSVAADGIEQIKRLLDEARQERVDLHGAQEAVQAQAEQLGAVTAQLAEARAELAQKITVAGNGQLGQMLEEVQQQREELRSAQDVTLARAEQLAALATELTAARNGAAETGTGASEEQLQRIAEDVQQQRDELHGAQEAARAQTEQLATVASALSEARRELAETRNEILRQCERLQADEDDAAEPSAGESLQQQVQQMEQQQSLLEQERRMLESELEAVRNRAAEMAESLADQKRMSAQQQSQWADELKRMRRLLESMSVRLAEAEIAQSSSPSEPRRPAGDGSDGRSASEGDDAALDSVVAQFEILQKDLARRRVART